MAGYRIDLLYAQPPLIDAARLVTHLQAQGIAAADPEAGRRAGALSVRYPGLPGPQPGRAPRTLIARQEEPLPFDRLRPALQQTRDWPAVAGVLATHHGALVLTDFLTEALAYQQRLALMQGLLAAVIDQAPPLAIHWQPSGRIVPPAAYLAAQRAGDRLFPAVHVRHFAVAEPTVQEMVSDTLGLAAFGLPDLQCHYRGQPAAQVEQVFMRTAAALFERGDFLATADTVAGFDPNQPWPCQRGLALIGPVREAITVTYPL
jgi:hypothetical protein